jgi:hypothetical protein
MRLRTGDSFNQKFTLFLAIVIAAMFVPASAPQGSAS